MSPSEAPGPPQAPSVPQGSLHSLLCWLQFFKKMHSFPPGGGRGCGVPELHLVHSPSRRLGIHSPCDLLGWFLAWLSGELWVT